MTGIDGEPCRIRDIDRNSKILRDIPLLDRKFDSFTPEVNRGSVRQRHYSNYDTHRVCRDFPRASVAWVNEAIQQLQCNFGEYSRRFDFKSRIDEGESWFQVSNGIEDPFHGLYHKHGDSDSLIVRFKRNLPDFDGFWHMEDLLTWIDAIDDFFEEVSPPEHVKCKIVLYKMKGAAYYWWRRLQADRNEIGKEEITSWPRMKKMLLRRFSPTKCLTKVLNESHNNKLDENLVCRITDGLYRTEIAVTTTTECTMRQVQENEMKSEDNSEAANLDEDSADGKAKEMSVVTSVKCLTQLPNQLNKKEKEEDVKHLTADDFSHNTCLTKVSVESHNIKQKGFGELEIFGVTEALSTDDGIESLKKHTPFTSLSGSSLGDTNYLKYDSCEVLKKDSHFLGSSTDDVLHNPLKLGTTNGDKEAKFELKKHAADQLLTCAKSIKEKMGPYELKYRNTTQKPEAKYLPQEMMSSYPWLTQQCFTRFTDHFAAREGLYEVNKAKFLNESTMDMSLFLRNSKNFTSLIYGKYMSLVYSVHEFVSFIFDPGGILWPVRGPGLGVVFQTCGNGSFNMVRIETSCIQIHFLFSGVIFLTCNCGSRFEWLSWDLKILSELSSFRSVNAAQENSDCNYLESLKSTVVWRSATCLCTWLGSIHDKIVSPYELKSLKPTRLLQSLFIDSDHVNLPETAKMEKIKSAFKFFGLPNCCGVIGDNHIVIPLLGTSVNGCVQDYTPCMFLYRLVDHEFRFLETIYGWLGGMTIIEPLSPRPLKFSSSEGGTIYVGHFESRRYGTLITILKASRMIFNNPQFAHGFINELGDSSLDKEVILGTLILHGKGRIMVIIWMGVLLCLIAFSNDYFFVLDFGTMEPMRVTLTSLLCNQVKDDLMVRFKVFNCFRKSVIPPTLQSKWIDVEKDDNKTSDQLLNRASTDPSTIKWFYHLVSATEFSLWDFIWVHFGLWSSVMVIFLSSGTYNYNPTRGRVTLWEGWDDENNSNTLIMTKQSVVIISSCLSNLCQDGNFKKTLKLFHKLVNELDPPKDFMASFGAARTEQGQLEDEFIVLGGMELM